MDREPSDSDLIELLKKGSEAAEEEIYGRYIFKLVASAQKNLRTLRPGAKDPELAANSALRSVLTRVKSGQIRELFDRKQLRAFLFVKLKKKIIEQRRRAMAEKRGAGDEVEEGDLFALAISADPGPEEMACFEELLRQAMECLNEQDLRNIAVKHLDGFKNPEIAKAVMSAIV
jgi:hypothetical protein